MGQRDTKNGSFIVVVDELEAPLANQKSIFTDALRFIRHEATLDAEKVERNLSNLCDSIFRILDNISVNTGKYKLDTFEVTVEIGAEGEVKLIGGVKGTITGGITLTFKKPE